MITESDLLSVKIFQDIAPELISTLAPRLEEKHFRSGDIILYRGDPGYSMFMVLEGSVAATLRNEEGLEYTLAFLDQGEIFGEMALITGEPRSANVRAVTDVRLAELSQDTFLKIISEYPKLNETMLQLLAQRRARTSIRWDFMNMEREEILARLFAQEHPRIDHIQGKSKWSRTVNASIAELAGSNENALVFGERGSGKLTAARLIHFKSLSREKPLLHLDCMNPPAISRELKKNRDELLVEIAQESALFGHGANAGGYARGMRRGYLELADGGAIILENVECLALHVQRALLEFLRTGAFARKGETGLLSTRMKIISTSVKSPEQLRNEEGFDPELLNLISGKSLEMAPLRKRKKDIPVIAMDFLVENSRKFGKDVAGFSEEALSELIDHNWPLNIRELKQVIERSAAVAQGSTVTAGQIFFNPSQLSGNRFNLLRLAPVQNILSNHWVPKGLQFVTVPFILAVIILTLAGPPLKNPANLMVWAMWWPFLIFSTLVASRSWCAYCPLPAISDGVNFWRSKYLQAGPVLEKYGTWIGVAGFAVIFAAEHASGMFQDARATALLLLSILAGTLIMNSVFGKRSWCKHICPLGKMVAHFSALSVIELTTNNAICSNQCDTHECVVGKSCPMGLHPAAAASSKDCILCFSCSRKCRHRSVRLDVRLPWVNNAMPRKWDMAGAFFSVLLIGLVVSATLSPGQSAMLASRWFGSVAIDPYFITAAGIVSLTVIVFVLAAGFPARSWKQNFRVSGYSCLFLGLAGLFGIYFHEFVNSGGYLLAWTLDMAGINGGAAMLADLSVFKAIFPVLMLIAYATSVYLIRHLGETYSMSLRVQRIQYLLVSGIFISMLFL